MEVVVALEVEAKLNPKAKLSPEAKLKPEPATNAGKWGTLPRIALSPIPLSTPPSQLSSRRTIGARSSKTYRRKSRRCRPRSKKSNIFWQ